LGSKTDGDLKVDLPNRALQMPKPIVIARIGPDADGVSIHAQPLQMLEQL
jgi:hypothetical protein